MRHCELDYIEILKELDLNGQQKLTNLMHMSKISCQTLREQLDFLKMNGLIEEKNLKKENAVYAITTRGIEILKAFKEITQVSSMDQLEKQEAPTPFVN
jgi:predicted transcriptional regulator